jgi:aminoacrylate hydrolase
MAFATLGDGDRLYYEVHGHGHPLFLVTGVYGYASFWPPSVVETLARHYLVVVHDQRGVGQSSRSRVRYSVAQMCDDVLRLYETLGVVRAHFVGHSLGGAIAQTMALDHPDMIDRLVLSATWPGFDPYFDNLIKLRRDMLARSDWNLYARLAALMMKPNWWVRDHANELFGVALPGPPDDVTRSIMIDRLDAILAFDRRADLWRIAASTLVIGARDDTWTPPYCAIELGAKIPNAETMIIPEGQHFFPQVFPERFADAILDFLGRPTSTVPAANGARERSRSP